MSSRFGKQVICEGCRRQLPDDVLSITEIGTGVCSVCLNQSTTTTNLKTSPPQTNQCSLEEKDNEK